MGGGVGGYELGGGRRFPCSHLEIVGSQCLTSWFLFFSEDID